MPDTLSVCCLYNGGRGGDGAAPCLNRQRPHPLHDLCSVGIRQASWHLSCINPANILLPPQPPHLMILDRYVDQLPSIVTDSCAPCQPSGLATCAWAQGVREGR